MPQRRLLPPRQLARHNIVATLRPARVRLMAAAASACVAMLRRGGCRVGTAYAFSRSPMSLARQRHATAFSCFLLPVASAGVFFAQRYAPHAI